MIHRNQQLESPVVYRVPSTIWGGSKRVSFLVGPDGKISGVFPDVDPGVHAKELLAVIASVKAPK